jgi:hypothetical protein
MIPTESEEVGLPRLVESSQPAGHERTYTRPAPEYSHTQVSAQKTGVQSQHILYSLSRDILYSFSLRNVVREPAITRMDRWFRKSSSRMRVAQ